MTQIAHRYFAEEEIQALLALPHSDQPSRFYELWSLKEAYIKARGLARHSAEKFRVFILAGQA